jgi:hypothetical protein
MMKSVKLNALTRSGNLDEPFVMGRSTELKTAPFE